MSIPLKLHAFEGPLDLLMHLIDKNKINIYDIPIVEITQQYLAYVQALRQQDLELMSEFLVMAATLIQIKAKMLLPVEKSETEEAIDPRQELVERLLEYKKYKLISQALLDKQVDAAKLMFKDPSLPDGILDDKEVVDVGDILKDVNLSHLYKIFNTIVKKKNDRVDPIRSNFGEITREEIHIQDKIDWILSQRSKRGSISFTYLLNVQASKLEIIVTFLAVLELMKIGKIHIEQKYLFDDIDIGFIDK